MHRKDLKNWNEIKTNDSWSVFKIMGEFVDGYEKMGKIGPCVSIFGSARTKKNDPYYKLTTKIAKDIVNLGFGRRCSGRSFSSDLEGFCFEG